MSPDASFWISHLELTRHIEGGCFNEIYRSSLFLSTEALPPNFPAGSNRHACTHIYFLLAKNQISALHRIKSDELWHFYAGDPLLVYEIESSGKLITHVLGNDPADNQRFFSVVKAGSWFGARLAEGSNYALVGCTVSPGFDYSDFELADRQTLLALYPQHRALIQSLTYSAGS